MLSASLILKKPGLFITATDTGVGKTVATCAMAAAMRRQDRRLQISVSKPFASGCRRDREGLVSEDTEAIAHFSDCRASLAQISPIRFAAPLAPAVAAERQQQRIDWQGLERSLNLLDDRGDVMLVEGVGGLLVPLDPNDPKCTVLTLMQALDYPAIIVARATLGTLNHTAMTVQLLKQSGCRIAGIIINGYDVDGSAEDPSINANRQWLKRMTGCDVLAVLPKVADKEALPHKGILAEDIIAAAETIRWRDLCKPPRKKRR